MTAKYVFSTSDTVHYSFPTHVNDLVLDRADAETSEVFIVVLEPGEGPPLHAHDDTEQIFFVLDGRGVLQVGEAREPHPVRAGDVVRIPPRTTHRIECSGPQALRYLSVDCFVGGRPTDEPTWDSHVQAMCARNGWDPAAVKRPRSMAGGRSGPVARDRSKHDD
jgi:quercetin dioxygenase-like cupin family protein